MKKKRIITGLIMVVVVGGAVAFFTHNGKSQDAQWLTLPVSRGNVDVVVTAAG